MVQIVFRHHTMRSSTVFLGLLLVALLCTVFGISRKCLRCICEVESGCRTNVRCGDNGRSCGPYQIGRAYWIDGGRRGSGYRDCVNSMRCSVTTVKAYMRRYANRRRLRREPTCEDFARIHNGGPNGYRRSSTDRYWRKIQNKGCWRYS